MKTPRAIDSFAEIATARIALEGTDPPIWREVELPTSITRLREFHDLPWTPAWRQLQAVIVAAKAPMRDNPIPALLRRAGGRNPLELDLALAQAIDRSLRRDGRADLALTFASDIGRLDALHARARVRPSGLLPRRFGPIREKPAARTAPMVHLESDPVAEAWAALAAAVRAIGCKADILSVIAPRAKAAGLRPQDLTAFWFAVDPLRSAGEGDPQRLLLPRRPSGRSTCPGRAAPGGADRNRPPKRTQVRRLIPTRLAA